MTDHQDTQDLHTFLDQYRSAHPEDVLEVSDQLAGEDVTALVFELAARGRAEMLVCHRVVGVDRPLVTNVFASRIRVARLFGVERTQLHRAYAERSQRPQQPRVVAHGPVLDEVTSGDQVDVRTLPMIRHFTGDRAPYITSGVLVAEGEPGAGPWSGNLSYHRAMVDTPNQLATSLHSRGHLWRLLRLAEERGEPLPVAMVVGGHPLFMLAASARVAAGVDERALAGGLFGQPLDVVRTPRHGIAVPASADLVLEGVIDPAVQVEEGPFGEFSGYSSNRSTHNALRVETVLRRRDAVLLDVVGGNSAEHLNLARIPRESEMAAQLTDRFPEVTALHYPTSGTHFHAYVALRQRRDGQARQVMLGLLGWDPYLKTVVAVDPDVDVTDDAAVLWAMATHLQPEQDVFVVGGLPGSPLDPSSTRDGTTSRMAIDATRGSGFDGERIEIAAAAHEKARALLQGT